MARACENCAFPDDELVAVRRAYVRPESWEGPEEVRLLDEVELWCVSCTTQYPHEPVA